ncbi:MAG TPA: AI-2E family transporter [Marmoricola sp.]|nr:AI-2E family transporter [Marmoricola sp.]
MKQQDQSEAAPKDTPEDAESQPTQEPIPMGQPFSTRSPFSFGFFVTMGALFALFVGMVITKAAAVLVLVVISVFLAAGLNPSVEWFMRKGIRRPIAVVLVSLTALLGILLFGVAIVPVVSEQISLLISRAPEWFATLQNNQWIKELNDEYDVITKLEKYLTGAHLAERLFGGVIGVGKAVLGFLGNAFVVFVMTIYFLASLPAAKRAAYSLAPASRRERTAQLSDQILRGVGGYVSGAFVIASCAGISTLVFLFIIGMGEYALALALIVALLDIIPLIGATIGAVVVSAIAFTQGMGPGIACVIFYIAYQQIENYLIYPRVMSRAVDIPGVVTVIAALLGASLLGVVGALLAIPTAAAVLLLTKEIVVRRQDQH